MKVIELGKNVLAANDVEAEALREKMKNEGRLLINLMSAPGSGKTTLLGRLIGDMRDIRFGVMEADIESEIDAERIEALGARAIQVHTGGMCHMDAYMTSEALSEMGADGLDIVFLENVGNLICPAEYDTGAGLKIMILSVPEGDDKPLKYPLMFRESDALVITKKDALDYFNFDLGRCAERAKKLNPAIKIFPVSAKTGEGMGELENYLREKLKNWRKI
ncbi:MAG: hydrogenase nickel incorporation protein HypB [Oscillospiraceae bacterium]|nr:hydrogenase nickel incorporation protein HypB [Oscillospiraceae bacterium]